MTTMFARRINRLARVGLAAAAAVAAFATPLAAQDDPNTGSLTLTGSFDVLPGTTYMFRGISQEVDPDLTLWPAADLGIALHSGEGTFKTVSVNFGTWNSLHTGSSGSDGPGKIHYEMDFYATLNLGFAQGWGLGTTYTAYTSPNGAFDTVNELMFKVSKAHRLAPYGILAFELDDDGQADGGVNSGVYLELGVGPSFPIGSTSATVTIPVKMGLSLNDYYEARDEFDLLTGEDETFGFFDVGAVVQLPIAGIPASYGSWNVHAGFDMLLLGNTTEWFNGGDNVKFTALFGIGFSY
jgi:hypothetical protein